MQLTATLSNAAADLTTWLAAETQAQAEAIAEELRGRLLEQFLTEGRAYAATPWLPRSTRRRELSRRPLLFRTGRLAASFTDAQSPEHVARWQPESLSLLFGSSVPYAPYHQFGTRRLPARPLLTAALLRGFPVADDEADESPYG